MDKVLELIVEGSDWESVLKEIIVEQSLDPWNIDISALADSLVKYMSQLDIINFRIPARFILISAILLRMKSETLIEKEIHERIPEILDLKGITPLELPIKRLPVRNITFEELTYALSKIVKDTQIKEEIRINKEQKIENIRKIIEMDLDNYVDRIYNEIASIKKTTFFTLTKGKEDLEYAKYFVAMLHLANQQKVGVMQEILFEDIAISLKEVQEIKEAAEKLEDENQNDDFDVNKLINQNSSSDQEQKSEK